MFPNQNPEELNEGFDNKNLANLKREELHSQVRKEKTQLVFETNRNEFALKQQSESLSIFFFFYINFLIYYQKIL